MIRWILKTMGQGLMALIPIGLTLGIILGLGIWLESLLAEPLKDIFPVGNGFYRMGMGIAAFLLLMFVCGLLMKLWVVQKLLALIEGWFNQLPLVKTVFSAIKDVMQFIGGGDQKKGDAVVMVTLDNGWQQLGIVTRQDFEDIPNIVPHVDGGKIAVYLPFSYQLGGFTYFMDKAQCSPVHGMSVEDAMRYSMMAWLGSTAAPKREEKEPDIDSEP